MTNGKYRNVTSAVSIWLWRRLPHPDTLVSGKLVTVEILYQESKVFAGGSVAPRLVLEEVKEAVQYFLFTPSAQKQDLFGGKVTAWFNG